ncbi:GNAT family N-acetyltransferase [Undibacterium danionis]|uniref:GNAT family N-acetyltransferase n=1 Tax=Undibacterium danionis TaxID=1812100 RepID=A0ABV6ID99_9BURK
MLFLPKPLSIRHAVIEDSDFFLMLYRDSRDDLLAAPIAGAVKEHLIQMQFLAHRRGIEQQYPNAIYFVVSNNAQPIARLVISIEENELRLIDVLVHSSARLQGTGSLLIAALKNYVDQNLLSMSLSVIRTNSVALHIYRKYGFVDIEDDGFVMQMCYRTVGQTASM